MDQNVHLKKKPEWLKYYSRGAQKMIMMFQLISTGKSWAILIKTLN